MCFISGQTLSVRAYRALSSAVSDALAAIDEPREQAAARPAARRDCACPLRWRLPGDALPHRRPDPAQRAGSAEPAEPRVQRVRRLDIRWLSRFRLEAS